MESEVSWALRGSGPKVQEFEVRRSQSAERSEELQPPRDMVSGVAAPGHMRRSRG